MTFHRCFAVVFAVLIYIAPFTLCTPKHMYTTIGSTVNLTCNLNVDRMYVTWLGPPNLSLYAIGNSVHKAKNFTVRILGNAQENLHILQIVTMHETNEGLYKCIATEGNKTFQLVIEKPPRNITIEDSHNSVVFGVVNKKRNLTCNVETGKPAGAMYWEYRHEVVANGGPGSLTYTFTPERTHHLKTFRCVAFNNVTRISLTEEVTLYVYFKPTVKIIPSGTINITEDRELILECNHTSNDNKSTFVTWNVPINGYIKQIPNTVVKLDNIKRSDAGQYSCSVSNLAGKTEDTVTVNVLYPPTVNITFQNQQQDKGIKCNAYGNPDDYVFFKWEHKTEYGDHIRFMNDSGSGYFEFKNISGEVGRLHDQGIYICSVSNGITFDGKMRQIATFTLKQKGSPYFPIINNRVQYGLLGKETNLTLNVVSNPRIETITVYNDNFVIIEEADYKIEFSKIKDIVYGTKVNVKGYKLFVPIKINVPEDFAMYTIVITNVFGQRNISIDLRSARPLRAPQNVKAVALDTRIIVRWTADRNIGLRETFLVEYRNHYESSWSQFTAEGRSTAIIDGLKSDEVYLLRVFSKTAAGESDKTDVIIVKTEKPLAKVPISTTEFALVFGAGFILLILFWCGTKVVKNRKLFSRDQDRIPPSHRNEETSVRLAQYDEIDSMYYNPLNITVSPPSTRNNAQLEILQPSTNNGNTDNCNTNNCSNNNITPAIIHNLNTSQENYSLRSSSDESYLVPCRNYLDLDIEKVTDDEQQVISIAPSDESYLVPCSNNADLDIEKITENDQQVNSIKDPEIPVEESSVSSDNSETNIKSIQRYEKLRLSDMNEQSNTEHMYNTIDT